MRYHLNREVSRGNIQTLTLIAVSSFGESLRWVPHHPSGGSHLSLLDLFKYHWALEIPFILLEGV
jgi:hypothetical protein